MEFVTEFDLANQQIVLNDIVSGHENTDFINSPVNGDSCVYQPFDEIEYPECCLDGTITNNDSPQHQIQIVKNRNGNSHMKQKKSKKRTEDTKLDQQQCPIVSCRAVFTSKLKLRKHIQDHAFKKQHQCDVCFEEFNVLENLTLHISLHSGDGRCPQCGKIFRRLASLEGHIKTHFKSELIFGGIHTGLPGQDVENTFHLLMFFQMNTLRVLRDVMTCSILNGC